MLDTLAQYHRIEIIVLKWYIVDAIRQFVDLIPFFGKFPRMRVWLDSGDLKTRFLSRLDRVPYLPDIENFFPYTALMISRSWSSLMSP